MLSIKKEKIDKFQEYIDYYFNNEDLLAQALTTPALGNEIGELNYEFLEILGDAIIKIVFILKLSQKGIKDPGRITKIKAVLESDKNLIRIAKQINLEEFLFKTERQQVKGTRILADVFEAICGAMFLDSNQNLNIVEDKMINPFLKNLDSIIENSTINNKSRLLEYLQERFKTRIMIKLGYEKGGFDHDPIWIAKKPQIIDKLSEKILIDLPAETKSREFGNKREAEMDIYLKILNYLKIKDN